MYVKYGDSRNKNNKEYFSSICESHNGSSLGFFFLKSIPRNGFDYILLACYLFEYKDELINKTWLVRKICIILFSTYIKCSFICDIVSCTLCRIGRFSYCEREPVEGTNDVSVVWLWFFVFSTGYTHYFFWKKELNVCSNYRQRHKSSISDLLSFGETKTYH